MKIGLIVSVKNSYDKKNTGGWGEDIISQIYAKAIRKKNVDCDIYEMEDLIKLKPIDVAIHTTDIINKQYLPRIAKKNILWIQGFNYRNGKIIDLDILYNELSTKYDAIMTASKKLSELKDIPFIIPCVDMERYHPVDVNSMHDLFDITYIGNLIKPVELVQKYISPLSSFKYELYGGDFGKISHEESLTVQACSKINLHFGFEEGIKWDMVTGTIFFHGACRVFSLKDKVPFFMEHYKDAIGFTEGGNDEIEKIKYYLGNDLLRKQMAENSYQITKEKFNSDIWAEKLLGVV